MKKPQKKIFNKEKIDFLRQQAVDKIKAELLPDKKIIKIILIGSSMNNSFGEDDYEIPEWLDKEPTGKPFPDNKLNLAYRKKNSY